MEISNLHAAVVYQGNAVSRAARDDVRPPSSSVATVDEQRSRAPAEHVIEGELLKERSFDDALSRDFLLWRHQAGQDDGHAPKNQYVGNALNTYRTTSEFSAEAAVPGRLDLYV